MLGLSRSSASQPFQYNYLCWKNLPSNCIDLKEAMTSSRSGCALILSLFEIENVVTQSSIEDVSVQFLNQISGPTFSTWNWKPTNIKIGSNLFHQMRRKVDTWLHGLIPDMKTPLFMKASSTKGNLPLAFLTIE